MRALGAYAIYLLQVLFAQQVGGFTIGEGFHQIAIITRIIKKRERRKVVKMSLFF